MPPREIEVTAKWSRKGSRLLGVFEVQDVRMRCVALIVNNDQAGAMTFAERSMCEWLVAGRQGIEQ